MNNFIYLCFFLVAFLQHKKIKKLILQVDELEKKLSDLDNTSLDLIKSNNINSNNLIKVNDLFNYLSREGLFEGYNKSKKKDKNII